MRLFRLALILLLILGFAITPNSPANAGHGNTNDFAPDKIFVKFKVGTDENTKLIVHGNRGGFVINEFPDIGVQVVRVPAGKVQQKVAEYQRERMIEYAEPVGRARVALTPNDNYYRSGYQWGLAKIEASSAWGTTTGSANIKVAILDTGIDQNHEDLADKIVANYIAENNTSTTVDDVYGHGTHVAGIAAAVTYNGIGVAGIGYNSKLLNVKVLDDTGWGDWDWIVDGILWAKNNEADVINMSFGSTGAPSTVESAVNSAWDAGVVLVAAAGNNGSSAWFYPAHYDNVIAVAATDIYDNKSSFSNYGTSNDPWVDVAAPGGSGDGYGDLNIYSTLPNHSSTLGDLYGPDYGRLYGTSMAAPFVSGLAALLWNTPYGTTNQNVRDRIERNSDNITDTGTYWRWGRINAKKALSDKVGVTIYISTN